MTQPMEVIGDLLFAAADSYQDRPWIHFDGEAHSFVDARRMALAAAEGFLDAGIEPGDRVVFVARNSADLVFQWFGLNLVGGAFVALNPDAPYADLFQQIERCDPKMIVIDSLAASAKDLLGLPNATRLSELGPGPSPSLPNVSGADVAAFIATSGSTGEPKMVMQTHRAYVLTAQAFPWWLRLTQTDRLMTSLPLFHLNAQVYSTLGSLSLGAELFLLPRFSASTFWEDAVEAGGTQVNMIGAMIEILMRQPPSAAEREHNIRSIYTAPAPSRSRHEEIEARFGVDVIIGYGMSESPYGTIWPADQKPYGSMGRLRQHPVLGKINQGRVVDDDGLDVSPGEIGELHLKNPATMAGYFGMPAETAKSFENGWLKTGDLVRQDAEGMYYFVSRRKHIIRRRGENLSATEVELVLEQHPSVLEAAVVGVPSELSDEEVKAFVVTQDRSENLAKVLQQWCLDRLAPFKVPRYWEFVDELPHTPTDRVAKHKLARLLTGLEFDSSRWPEFR